MCESVIILSIIYLNQQLVNMGRGDALVETIIFKRRVVDLTPALAAT